jgi:hypothetical protein
MRRQLPVVSLLPSLSTRQWNSEYHDCTVRGAGTRSDAILRSLTGAARDADSIFPLRLSKTCDP